VVVAIPRRPVSHSILAKELAKLAMDRPQDIEDEGAMSFFGGSEGDADESQG